MGLVGISNKNAVGVAAMGADPYGAGRFRTLDDKGQVTSESP